MKTPTQAEERETARAFLAWRKWWHGPQTEPSPAIECADYQDRRTRWLETRHPAFVEFRIYRVKPEKKPRKKGGTK